jgi:magnesium-transporting ATPase (P-type)
MVLTKGQTAFLMTVVWTQIANLLIRKTQVASIFNAPRLLKNRIMIYSIAFEVILICLLVYVPGLN